MDRATGALVPAEGKSNLTFTVEIENKSDSGGIDTYLLQVKENGTPLNGYFMTSAVNLQGGDVKVVR